MAKLYQIDDVLDFEMAQEVRTGDCVRIVDELFFVVRIFKNLKGFRMFEVRSGSVSKILTRFGVFLEDWTE